MPAQSGLYPLRDTIGDLLPITAVSLHAHAPQLSPSNIALDVIPTITSDTFRTHSAYAQALPGSLTMPGGPFARGDGVASFPPPIGARAGPKAGVPFAFIAVNGPMDDGPNLSRDLWIEINIRVAWPKGSAPVIGGILFGGYPYLPYYVTDAGETSANFGLPREIRVGWSGQHGDGFLDSETQITRQEICSHSDAQTISIGRVETTDLRIRLADFPKFLLRNRPVAERWGILMPYLFVYAHTEGSRYAPEVPAGVLAATQSSLPVNQGALSPVLANGSAAEKTRYRGTATDYISTINQNDGARYYAHSAAAAVGGAVVPRSYPASSERFTTCALAKGDRVRLILSQSEQFTRCLAGLKLHFAKPPAFTSSVNGPKTFARPALQVFEVDPPAGASPIALDRDLERDRYCRRLGTYPADDLADVFAAPKGLRFTRSTNARILALEFTATEPGHIALAGVSLVQSAHVAVTPRPSCRQRVTAMHFRMMGENIAADLAQIGTRGFSLRVEHLLAGQRQTTLLDASSLLDLLQSPARVRQYSASRAEDISETLPGSFSVSDSARRDTGWTRQETGDGLSGAFRDQIDADGPDPTPDGRHGYTQITTQESRAHQEQIGDVAQWFIDALISTASGATLTPDNTKLARDGRGGIWTPWNPLNATLTNAQQTALIGELTVSGQWNVNLPPFAEALWNHGSAVASQANTTLGAISGLDPANPATFPTAMTEISNLAATLNTAGIALDMTKALLVSGVSVGVSPGGSISGSVGGLSSSVSFGGSVSANIAVPAISHSTSLGDGGTITRQGAMVDYSYNQSLTDSYHEGRTRTDYLRGRTARATRRRVHWQGEARDVITGTLPLGLMLPATADYAYSTTDQAIRVVLGAAPGLGKGKGEDFTTFDIWFDIDEEPVRDDY